MSNRSPQKKSVSTHSCPLKGLRLWESEGFRGARAAPAEYHRGLNSEITAGDSHHENNERNQATNQFCHHRVLYSGHGVVVVDDGSSLIIRNSTVITNRGNIGPSAYDTDTAARVANPFVPSGAGVTSGGGTVTCAGVTDENYTFYASSCPS